MPDPAQLAALAAVHRRGSFDLAAASLHVTRSAISQRIKALEEAAGTLLIRRGQPCQATEAGLRLIRHHDEIALLEQGLAADLPQLSQGSATLRIAVNADSLATWVIPALARVPDVLFDLVIDDQDVSQDWLRRGEVVAAITALAPPPPGCDAFPLGALRFSDKDQLQERWVNAVTGSAPARAGLPCHRLASSQGFVDACLAGLGWGLNPEALVQDHLGAGRLVELQPGQPLDVALCWQVTRLAAPALAPLTRAIRAAAAAALV